MGAEFCFSIGTKIAEYLVEPLLIRPLRPIFYFGSVVDDFHDQNKKLTAIQERVEHDVQRDRDNAQVVNDHVEKWVEKVKEEIMPQVQDMLNDLLGGNKSCFRYSWCPSWNFHYSFSKQVSKMVATMKALCLEGDSFGSVSHPPALHQPITGPSSSPFFIHSQSSRLAFHQIKEALRKGDINLFKLYGVTGAGKTTVAQLVVEEAKNLFDHIIMVPVAQYPLVSSQQDFIAAFLGLQFDQVKIEQGRAAKLWQRLNNGDKILIIFDDVQKEFNLSAVIGIPPSHSGCKILLTTRHQTVAEIHVHTQKDIQLGAFSEDEAWDLLKRITGVDDEARTHDVAKDALEDCIGLPKAIVAMGKVLKGKGVHKWEETLRQLNAERGIIFSEDFLFSKAAKSAFHQILEELNKDGVNMIGLYGMGGIGKTTLASQVLNKVKKKNELAVMVTVSQKPDVGNMQDKIADFLNLKFEKKDTR